jgi:quinol monooxygenase YgiN
MAIRHVITIQVAPGRAAEFAAAFEALRSTVREQDGCEEYDLFQSLEEPDRVVILERWNSQERLDRHMEAERTQDRSAVDALVALWAPGSTPTVERFEG